MKKLFVLVFAIALCLGALCIGASADYSGTPKKPAQGDGTEEIPYQIGTAEELYWFAGLVNGDTTIIGSGVQQNKAANAVLTADITINEDVLSAVASGNTTGLQSWTPIGSFMNAHDFPTYTGTFDGQGHTISGLYYSGSGYGGLFGCVGSGGQVKNVKVADSYINGRIFVGGVCGTNNGTITNCSFDGSVTGNIVLYLLVGGVCGYSNGTVEDCSNSGTVTCDETGSVYAGGVCGQNVVGTITNCYNTGNVNGSGTYTSGVCGNNSSGTITNCYNTGNVTGNGTDAYVGGVCGDNSSYSTITNCYNTGDVTGTGAGNVGGVCAYNSGFSTITNCYNTGSVTGTGTGDDNVGGVCGHNYFGTITNCYNMGNVSDGGNNDNVGGVCGCNDNSSTIKNCYWLSGKADGGVGSGTGEATSKTTTEFTSGEVAWLLNGGTQMNGPWRQDLSVTSADDFPVLDNNNKPWVHYNGTGYENGIHAYNDGFCSCGAYKPATLVDGVYQIGNAGQLYWFAQQVNEGDYDANAKLTKNITINENVLKTDGTLNRDGSSFTQWTPICGKKIGDNYTKYTGTFDGDGHTISGLYYDGSGDYVGLFGYVGSSGRVQNVKVADSYISNSEGIGTTGGVCGYNRGTIMNCSFSGSVTGTGWFIDVGGVCGASLGTIENCRNSGSVTGSGTGVQNLYVGGVCGANYSTITNCCNSGSVTGSGTDAYVGGVCGYNNKGTITNCYNTDSVTVSVTGSGNGNIYAGGVCGSASSATITNCYNTGDVTVSVTGSGNGNIYAGGVCGRNIDGTITNCYWLSGKADGGVGSGTGEATSKTTTEFTSGEVAWLLNQGQEYGPWRQNLSGGNDNYPTLDSTQEIVFQVMLDETDCYCNGSFTIPASPSRPGYTFVGWSDGNKTYEAGDGVTITADTKFTAVWKQLFTVTVVYDNGTADTKEQVVDGGSFKLPAEPSRSGYTFVGWSDGNKTYEAGDTVTNITADMKFTAMWQKLFTVTVVYGNGTEDEIKSVASGDTFKLPAAPSKSGYTFVHWSDGNKTYDPGDSVPITGNVTFTAVWQAINIPDPNGITVTQPANGTIRVNPSNGSAGTLITVTATPDEGYELAYITVDGEKITGNTFRMPDKAVTVSAVFVPVTFPFTDVKSGDWFYDYVAYVYSNGLMDGTSDTAFEPNANMTRAMVWAILARVDGENVTGAAWATDARAWAMAEGVSDGTDPNGLVTREQFATMLYRYAVAKGYDVSIGESTNILSYADFASISEYAIPAMQWACGSGIVTGVTDSTLAPQGTATRAQCAAMLMRFVEL